MPNSSSRKRPFWPIVLALIVLALIPFAIYQTSEKEDEVSSSSSERNTFRTSTNSRSSSARRSQRSPSPDPPPRHTSDDLKNFLLPPTELSNISLDAALSILTVEYRRICRLTKEGPTPFQWSIGGTADPINFLTLEGDLLTNLNLIAAIAGTKLEIDGHQFTFREVKENDIVSRRWTVPPPFEVFLGATLAATPNVEGHDQIAEYLRRLNLSKKEDALSYLKSSANLTVTSAPQIQYRFDSLTNAAGHNFPIQTILQFQGEGSQTIPVGVASGFAGGMTLDTRFGANFANTQLLVSAEEFGFGREIRVVCPATTPHLP